MRHQHDSRLSMGFDKFFWPALGNQLVPEWLAAVPELVTLTRWTECAAHRCGQPRHSPLA